MDNTLEIKINIAQKVLGLGKDNVSSELWKAADKVLTDFLNPRAIGTPRPLPPLYQSDTDPLDF